MLKNRIRNITFEFAATYVLAVTFSYTFDLNAGPVDPGEIIN